MQAPKAKKIPCTHVKHGEVRHDPYYWMRELDTSPAVMAHIEAENAYCAHVMSTTATLQTQIAHEIRSRIREEWCSVPVSDGPYQYYSRYTQGAEYPLFCRRQGEHGVEEVCLNEPEYAQDKAYFDVAGVEVSPDHRLLLWAADEQGDEQFSLHLRDLTLEADLPLTLAACSGSFCWFNDNRHFVYIRLDEQNRPLSAWRHRLGTTQAEDVCLLDLPDGDLFLSVERTRDNQYLIITAGGSSCSQCWYLPADNPQAQPQLVSPLREGVEYYVDHRLGEFWLLTNDEHPNFRIARTAVVTPSAEHWQTVIAGSDERLLDSVSCFAGFVAYSAVREGLSALYVWFEDRPEQQLQFADAAWECGFGSNPDFMTRRLRYSYSTLVQPVAISEYDVDSGETTLLQQYPLPGFDPQQYEILRLWATGHDGVKIPLTMVKPARVTGAAPLVLCGYGAYGEVDDLGLARSWLPLLERGMICVQAHVRGSATLGRDWYEQGKLAHKQNSFRDLIACTEYLIAQGYTRAGMVGISGGSAGGLLVAAALNLRPELFGAVVAAVPFVDTLTTMLDPSLPLTCLEYDEWGCPEEEEAYQWIRAYSPYDNLQPNDFPPVLATAGLHDTRVTYWEPLKWIAKLRDMQQGNAPLLCRTETEAGHGGASGRYGWIEEAALIDAFLIRFLQAKTEPQVSGA